MKVNSCLLDAPERLLYPLAPQTFFGVLDVHTRASADELHPTPKYRFERQEPHPCN